MATVSAVVARHLTESRQGIRPSKLKPFFGGIMKKALALVSSLLLVATLATPAQSAGAKYSVYQRTLATFSSSATTLTSQQRAQVKATVEANPTAEKFICTGIRYYDQAMSVNITVRKRAKAACDYAKQLNPALSTWFQNKPTQARSYAGKVLLTVKSAKVPISLDNLELNRTLLQAWESVSAAKNSNDSALPTISIYKSPMVTEAMVASEQSALNRVAQLWGNDFLPTNARIIYSLIGDHPTERAWLEDTTDELGGLNYMLYGFGWGDWHEDSCGALGSNGGGFYTIVQCLGRSEPAVKSQQIIAHEYTHWYQFSQGNMPRHGPNWLVEGGATFYGMAMAFEGSQKAETYRLRYFGEFMNAADFQNGSDWGGFKRSILDSTDDEFAELMTELETMDSRGASRSYILGAIASEALVASFGHQNMRSFYRSFVDTPDWKSSFEIIYGTTVQEFYKKLRPYAVAVIENSSEG